MGGLTKSDPLRAAPLPTVPPEAINEPSAFNGKGVINVSKPSSSRTVRWTLIMVTCTATMTGSVWVIVSMSWTIMF